jgi:hypothetical protein
MTKRKKKKLKKKLRPKKINVDLINLHKPFGISTLMHERDRQLEDLVRNPNKYRK